MVELSPDTTFSALADPTRREILDCLKQGEASVSALAEPFDVSLQAISKHVGVLAEAGLVAREKRGRVQWCRLQAAPVREADAWLCRYRRFWTDQLARTDPGALARWFRGEAARTLSASLDLRVGGAFRITVQAGPDVRRVEGVHRQVDAPRALLHTRRWDVPDVFHQGGWGASLEHLGATLAGSPVR